MGFDSCIAAESFSDAGNRIYTFYNTIFQDNIDSEETNLFQSDVKQNESEDLQLRKKAYLITNEISQGSLFFLPRYFFKFNKDLELVIKFNEEIDRQQNKIKVNSNIGYVLEVRCLLMNLSKVKYKKLHYVDLNVSLVFHHNYGSSTDVTNLISKQNKKEKVVKSGVIDINFLFTFPHIGKYTITVKGNVVNMNNTTILVNEAKLIAEVV